VVTAYGVATDAGPAAAFILASIRPEKTTARSCKSESLKRREIRWIRPSARSQVVHLTPGKPAKR